MTLFADRELATRIERLAARDLRLFAESSSALFPELHAAWHQAGEGIAGFCGPDSAVNGTLGLGMSAEVTETDIDELERFFRDRGARPRISVCPLADPSLVRWLTARGWAIVEFENVLVRELSAVDAAHAAEAEAGPAAGAEPAAAIEIRVADSAEERAAWAELLVEGFSAPAEPSAADVRLGRTVGALIGRTFLTAFVDGEPAGTGELLIADGIGWLSADTTLPRFRGRGVQQALQRARLRMARDAGCELAVTESTPGSGSQRNMERLDFRVVYTRTEVAGPPPDGGS